MPLLPVYLIYMSGEKTTGWNGITTVTTGMEQSLTVEQIAEILGITSRIVLNFTKRRKDPIPHFRLSRKVILFRISEVEPWFQQFHQGGGMQATPEKKVHPKAKPAKPVNISGKRWKSDAEIRAEMIIEEVKTEVLETG